MAHTDFADTDTDTFSTTYWQDNKSKKYTASCNSESEVREFGNNYSWIVLKVDGKIVLGHLLNTSEKYINFGHIFTLSLPILIQQIKSQYCQYRQLDI